MNEESKDPVVDEEGDPAVAIDETTESGGRRLGLLRWLKKYRGGWNPTSIPD